MAYAVLLSLTETIHRILNDDDDDDDEEQQYPISENGKQRIKLLQSRAFLFRDLLLEEFPKDAMTLEISDAANEAEDVMEHFMYEHLHSHFKSIRSTTDILYDFRELDIVIEEFNSIAQEVKSIQKEREQSKPSLSLPAPAPASAVETVTVGLKELVDELRGLLCGGELERQIIPITGMCGIGKTTLANTLYHHPEVINNFPVRGWVTVSPEYETENVFEHLLRSLEGVVEQGLVESSYSTADKLHRILSVSKYLLVVDDIWTAKAWDDVERAFGDPHKRNGSRIVITTRIDYVVYHASPSTPLHKMGLMDEHNSWVLLKHKVFPNRECPPALEKIGQSIAKGCRGMPLAIVALAGILSATTETPSSWKEVEENLRSLLQKDVQFQKRMFLSYTHLPLYMRPHLLYMGGFPEDCEIRVSKLSKLWIAESFLKTEEDAESCLLILERVNLVMITATKSNGKFKSCNLHRFISDMCETIVLDENYERRLSVAHPELRCLAKHYASTIRSVICFRPTESSLVGLRKLRLLRVLDVVDTHAYSLPPQVFELFHLRYLAFGCPMEIPAAISRLQNLRTLIIRPSKRLRRYSTDEVYLPLEIWMMPLLEHLVSFFDLLPNPPGAASALENLLTLSVVKKLICTQEMMRFISNVKKLAITYFRDKYQEDYQLHNLVLLRRLEKLTLVVKNGDFLRLKANPVFPKMLKKLTLSGWRFPWEDMKAIATLPNLRVLKLRDHAFVGKTWETDDGQFWKLEYLLIDETDLENWVTQEEHFPALKRIVINGEFLQV